jgi:hypothetical protein
MARASTITLELATLGKFNFTFLSKNQNDDHAGIIISGLEIKNYRPQNTQ